MTGDNKATVQRFIDEVMNGRSRAAVDDTVSSSMLAGHLKGGMDNIEALFSNIRYDIDAMVEDDDAVAVFCTLHGTHTGEVQTPFITVAATGREVMIPYAYRFRVGDGRILSMIAVSDFLQALTQITAKEPSQ